MKKLLLILTLLFSVTFSVKNSIAHEDIKRVPVDCSSSHKDSVKVDMSTYEPIPIVQRWTWVALPLNYIKKHINIPEDPEGIEDKMSPNFYKYARLPIVVIGKSPYKFKDVTRIFISNKDGVLEVINNYAEPMYEVSSENIDKIITDVECFILM